jgi:transposase InsO family protein
LHDSWESPENAVIGGYEDTKMRGGPVLLIESQDPKPHPRKIPPKSEVAILKMRKKYKEGPDRLAVRLDISRSTVYQVLKRNGENHLFERKKKERARRYEKRRPGESLQMDLKQLPALGGKRYRYQASIVDDCTRYAEAEIFERKTRKEHHRLFSGFLG